MSNVVHFVRSKEIPLPTGRSDPCPPASLARYSPSGAVNPKAIASMKEIGYDQISISPHYDRETEQAIKQIQAKYGLTTDGIVGPLTKIALFNEKKTQTGPRIADR